MDSSVPSSKKVALVLASGGARGMAHIGAIEELTARGYEITSIAGCSIGSLIAGIYAAGKIAEARDWFGNLDLRDVLSLTDFNIGWGHLVKGERVMSAIQEWVPDRLIEELPIPASFVATDLLHSQEVVFSEGSLFEAIRASISIPLCFEPVQKNGTLLVDGGLTNPFPLDRVARQEGDILMGVNISGRTNMDRAHAIVEAPPFLQKLGKVGDKLEKSWQKVAKEVSEDKYAASMNYISLTNRMIDIQIQNNCMLRIEKCQPAVVVDMPQDAYTTFDFDKASEIMDRGREMMSIELDKFEQSQN
ncbi:MAG: patatin-like phospholipase family protein [Paludibacteraceae bacterium]|nr:patatin-like phospholipase family protein [Paludibacteraceae bacterium]